MGIEEIRYIYMCGCWVGCVLRFLKGWIQLAYQRVKIRTHSGCWCYTESQWGGVAVWLMHWCKELVKQSYHVMVCQVVNVDWGLVTDLGSWAEKHSNDKMTSLFYIFCNSNNFPEKTEYKPRASPSLIPLWLPYCDCGTQLQAHRILHILKQLMIKEKKNIFNNF